MKWKHTPRATTATAWLVCGSLLLTWFVSMLGITWITSLNYLNFYEEKSNIYGSAMSSWDLERAERSDFPGAVEESIWSKLAYGSNHAYEVDTVNGDLRFGSDNSFDWQTAAAVYDGDGNLIASSGDFLFFAYDTEEHWENADVDSAMNRSGYTKVDLDMAALTERIISEDFYSHEDRYFWGSFFTFDTKCWRFTGVFDGMEFRANRIEYVLRSEFENALHSREPDEHEIYEDGTEYIRYEYSYSEVIRTEGVPWHTLYDNGQRTEGAVTIYTTNLEDSIYEEGGPLTFEGDKYDTLFSLLLSQGISDSTIPGSSNGSFFDLIVMEQSHIFDYDKPIETPDGGHTYATKYYITTAVRCSPLLSAISKLKGLYTVTFLLTAALALIVCRILRRRLVEPLQQTNEGIAQDFTWHVPNGTRTDDWREVQELYQHYTDIQYRLQSNRMEINRLNTALEYAKDAEQNRRQMTSNVAHELKTPLAVIHSYAEGLKEHIAEEKRDKYIDVILAESEHLDDMVLELLDLSRLEAGKVKLALDSVSLIDLTHNVFERLDMAAQAKELNITFDLPEACTIQADEARIKQVIENFASNAVKYTPVGGNIRVTVSRQEFRTRPAATTFAIENDSPPLSDEALSKVWETFYRTDDARSGGGTGLGLAIAKNIVELHGGTCGVRNTESGVEFKFTI